MRAGVSREIQAEQALLGAILSDPPAQARLLSLVEPEDMTRPYHGQVLLAMQRLQRRGILPDPMGVHQEIKKDPDLPAAVSHDGVLLADLMEASPRAEHAPAYAAMAIDGSIRRQVALAAARMSQAATGGDPAVALRMAERARAELDRCQARWEALPEQMRRELPARAQSDHVQAVAARQLGEARDELHRLRQGLAWVPQRRLEERLAEVAEGIAGAAAASAAMKRSSTAPSEARPSGREAEAAGAQALRDLAAAPSNLREVTGWLRPSHFARPEQGELYVVMRDLDAAGQPVDPVTVSWEASRRGLAVDAAHLTDGMGPFAVTSARAVHRHGLLAQFHHAGQDIRAGAAELTLSTSAFLLLARDHLDRVDPGPVRWPAPQAASLPAGQPSSFAATHRVPSARERVPEATS